MKKILSYLEKYYKHFPIILFIVSVIVLATFLFLLPDEYQINQSSDYFSFYRPVVQNILSGQGYTVDGEHLATFYPPGYAIILTCAIKSADLVSIDEDVAVSAINYFGFGVCAVLIYLLSKKVYGYVYSILASILWITYPFLLWLMKQPNTEIPFMASYYASLYIFFVSISGNASKKKRIFIFISGFLLGFAMLIRPIAIALSIIYILFYIYLMCIHEKLQNNFHLVSITCFLIGIITAIGPWEYWAYQKTGKIIPLSTAGDDSIIDGLRFAINPKGYRKNFNLPKDVVDFTEAIQSRLDMDFEGTLSALLFREASENPVGFVKFTGIKAARSWYGTDSGRLEGAIFPIQIIYLVLIFWGSIRSWRWNRIAKAWVILVSGLTLYFWGMTLVSLSILRYMIPAMGLLLTCIPAILFQWPKFSNQLWLSEK